MSLIVNDLAAAIRATKQRLKVQIADPRKVFAEVGDYMRREVEEISEPPSSPASSSGKSRIACLASAGRIRTDNPRVNSPMLDVTVDSTVRAKSSREEPQAGKSRSRSVRVFGAPAARLRGVIAASNGTVSLGSVPSTASTRSIASVPVRPVRRPGSSDRRLAAVTMKRPWRPSSRWKWTIDRRVATRMSGWRDLPTPSVAACQSPRLPFRLTSPIASVAATKDIAPTRFPQ